MPLLSARPAVTFPAAEHHRPLAGTKLYCLVTEAYRCEQLAQGCYAALLSRIWTHDLLIASPTLYPLRHRVIYVQRVKMPIVTVTNRQKTGTLQHTVLCRVTICSPITADLLYEGFHWRLPGRQAVCTTQICLHFPHHQLCWSQVQMNLSSEWLSSHR